MTVFGWDMSHYDGPSIGTAVSQGISFITHKAGGDALDQELDEWWTGVRGLPSSVILGAYWVLYPGDPAGRAASFLSRLDSACPGWRNRDSFILQADCEKWGGDSGTVPSISDINAFCASLVARTGGKYRPIVYAPKWVYGNVSQLKYPVWASSYVSGPVGSFKAMYPGDDSGRWNPYGKPVDILQYTSSATIGGQTTCDANAYRGTVLQLKQLVTPGGIMAQLDQEDYDNIAAAVTSRIDSLLRSENSFARAMRAAPWQYSNSGLQGATNSLQALSDSQPIKAMVTALVSQVAAISPDVDETALAAQITANLVDPLKSAIMESLPEDLDSTVRASVESAVEEVAGRFRLSVDPEPTATQPTQP